MGNFLNKKTYSKIESHPFERNAIFNLTVYNDGSAYAMFDDDAKKHINYEVDAFMNDKIHGGSYPHITSYQFNNNLKIHELITYLKNNK
jgi:hypothetical protein